MNAEKKIAKHHLSRAQRDLWAAKVAFFNYPQTPAARAHLEETIARLEYEIEGLEAAVDAHRPN